MIRRPHLIVGIYKPEVWDAEVIGKAILAQIARFKFISFASGAWPEAAWKDDRLDAEVRVDYQSRKNNGHGWHKDYGDNSFKQKCFMIVWASKQPTQIRQVGEKKVYQPEPYQIVLFDNTAVEHQQPLGDATGRYFFRQVIQPLKEGQWVPK